MKAVFEPLFLPQELNMSLPEIEEMYIIQCNYPMLEWIRRSVYVKKDDYDKDGNGYLVAVFRIKRKVKKPIELSVKADTEIFAVN